MSDISTAFFSFEIGLDSKIPNYAGGLGILAGDMLKSSADLNLNVVGVSLLYSKGVFQQRLDSNGIQTEFYLDWKPTDFMVQRDEFVEIKLDNRVVKIKIWEYKLKRTDGGENFIYFLDTNCPENEPEDREICSELYPANEEIWLKQQIILGIGGVKALQALGYPYFDNYHLNESHDMFVLFELKKQLKSWQKVKQKVVVTIHTPLPGAHKILKIEEIKKILDPEYLEIFEDQFFDKDEFNQTQFVVHFSKYANGVALKHGITTQQTYPDYEINSITNGIHPQTWASPHMQKLFDTYLKNWRTNPAMFHFIYKIPNEKLLEAHKLAKQDLIKMIKEQTGEVLEEKVFTICSARRKVAYKRPLFLFSDINRLNQIADQNGGLQIVFAGKAWPKYAQGKQLLKDLFELKNKLSNKINVVFVPNYNMDIAYKLVSGADLWLNSPMIPWEASGTSGMKASLNGVPNFSVLDGWWIEGWVEGVTGWAIGDESGDERSEIEDLYNKLEKVILPTYQDKSKWGQLMSNCIGINASYFNTHRVMSDYLAKAYSKHLKQENITLLTRYFITHNPIIKIRKFSKKTKYYLSKVVSAMYTTIYRTSESKTISKT